MSEVSTEDTGATEGTPELNPQEQAALQVAREGLPEVNPNAVPDKTARPANVPEKFWKDGKVDTEALLASYGELEGKLGAPKETPAAAEETEAETGEPATRNGKIVKPAPAAAEEEGANPLTGLIEGAATEFQTDGKFSDETSEALEKAGIPKALQQVYLAGLEASAAQQEARVHSFVGGEAEYTAMARWAGQHLSDAELEAFNAALDNPNLTENAVRGLHARFKAAKPSEGKQVSPASSAASMAGDIFQSRKEFTDALGDPRYKTDAAYQRQVIEKLSRTRKAGRSFN